MRIHRVFPVVLGFASITACSGALDPKGHASEPQSGADASAVGYVGSSADAAAIAIDASTGPGCGVDYGDAGWGEWADASAEGFDAGVEWADASAEGFDAGVEWADASAVWIDGG